MKEYVDNRIIHRDSTGRIHRSDGPAIEYTNGKKLYYLRGECMSYGTFLQELQWGYNEEDYLKVINQT